MNKISCTLLSILLIMVHQNTSAQSRFFKLVQPIANVAGSTALSIFDTNPESPDGKYIAYIYYPEIVRGGHGGPIVESDIIIQNRATGEEKILGKAWVTNHNGAHGIWVNDSTYAVQVMHQYYFEVFNVHSASSLLGKIYGELPHKSYDNKIFYSKCNTRLLEFEKDRKVFCDKEEGIWLLDITNGREKQIVNKQLITNSFMNQDPSVSNQNVQLLHIEPNQLNDQVLFDFRHRKEEWKNRKELQGYVRADGTGVRLIPTRPMHVVWYDNQSMFGVDTKDTKKRIFQYDLDGNRLDLLGGSATHVGASPDRKWYVGEKGYYQPDTDQKVRVCLYEKGNEVPVAILSEWINHKITWSWVAHVNPSFSADGQRIYFIRACEEEKFEAVSIKLKEILALIKE